MLLKNLMSCYRPFARTGMASRRVATSAAENFGSHGIQYKGNTYPYRWLRDSCQCPECVHPSTRQKLHRTTDIPATVEPCPDGLDVSDHSVNIIWNTGHHSTYTPRFLETYSSSENIRGFHRDVDATRWNKQQIEYSPHLFLPYRDLQTPSGLLAAITQLSSHGLLFVKDVPNKETSHERCEARKLAQLFSEIRTTFYGELWDVTNTPNSTNIAYTNLELRFHMDLLYFQHPPRYQLLHCLRNRVEGGGSMFVDAIDVAEQFRSSHPSDFKVLATTPVPFHYINDGKHLHNEHTTIVLDEHAGTNDILAQPIKYINYAPSFQAPFPISTPPQFYSAFEKFASYLDDPLARFEYTLCEGDAVLFDNRRVLHARASFSAPHSLQDGDDINRWLKGCYFEGDSLLSRGRLLREELDL